jgi:hypothetical protein
VREVVPAGFVQTTKNPNDIKLFSGENSKNNNFGNHNGIVLTNSGYGKFGHWGFGMWYPQFGGPMMGIR